MAALLQDLHFSKYNIVIEVLWNEFADEVPPGDAPAFALTLLPAMEEVFARYPLADGFTYTAAGRLLPKNGKYLAATAVSAG